MILWYSLPLESSTEGLGVWLSKSYFESPSEGILQTDKKKSKPPPQTKQNKTGSGGSFHLFLQKWHCKWQPHSFDLWKCRFPLVNEGTNLSSPVWENEREAHSLSILW